MYGDNGSKLLRALALLALFACGAGAWAVSYFWGPEADSRAAMMLRTPTATPLPTPNPAVVAEQDLALTKAYRTGGDAGNVLIIVVTIAASIVVGSWAARAGASAGAKVKAARGLPPWAALPDQATLLALGGGYEVYDPRFDSVTRLEAGDKPSDQERGETLIGQPHPVVEVVQALLAVPRDRRDSAWHAAARHYQLEDGRP
jgi:hypothetical protein